MPGTAPAKAGQDVQRLLPQLATYLGHIDTRSTQRYLQMTPDLLDAASQRFAQYAMGPTMKDESLFGPWIRRFLLEHLVAERNLSRNTQASYRDTLTLLLPFASKQEGCAIDRMTVEELTPAIVRKFLDHLERDRRCSEATRNQGLRPSIPWRASSACVRRSTSPPGLVFRDKRDTIQEDGKGSDWISRKG
ncbi:site-specific integrase [Mesorhizobium sp. M0909]|uniref:site-specific integrase n=1 Tax=Mesorhizobium sp. M0909 TaxID=2957024 RepID=UPI003334BB8D